MCTITLKIIPKIKKGRLFESRPWSYPINLC